jgi:hypothetical protein
MTMVPVTGRIIPGGSPLTSEVYDDFRGRAWKVPERRGARGNEEESIPARTAFEGANALFEQS